MNLRKPGLITLSALSLVFFLNSGCAFTKMETAHQLDQGDTVVAGSLDWPGLFFVLPRVQVSAAYGLGSGDISGHFGTSLLLFNGGLGGRLYLSEWVTLSLQSDAMFALRGSIPFAGTDRLMGVITATPRLTTSATEDRPVYAGIQSNILTPTVHTPSDGWKFEAPIALGGFLLGVDHRIDNSNVGIQLELIVTPFAMSQGETAVFTAEGTAAPFGQFSIGLYFLPNDDESQQELEPTPELDADEPAPRRKLDDQGVPTY